MVKTDSKDIYLGHKTVQRHSDEINRLQVRRWQDTYIRNMSNVGFSIPVDSPSLVQRCIFTWGKYINGRYKENAHYVVIMK